MAKSTAMSLWKKRQFFTQGVHDCFHGKANPFTPNSKEWRLWKAGSNALVKRQAFNRPALFLDARSLVSSSLVHELDGSFVAQCVNRFCNA